MAARNLTPADLSDIARRIHEIRAVVITTISALNLQNADHDADVATTLQRSVSDPLSMIVERLDPLTQEGRS